MTDGGLKIMRAGDNAGVVIGETFLDGSGRRWEVVEAIDKTHYYLRLVNPGEMLKPGKYEITAPCSSTIP